MIIKEGEIIKVVTKKVYIAFDGAEFDTFRECEDYERALAKKMLEVIEHCDSLDGYVPFDGGENMESHDYTWYKPKNLEEIKMLKKYLNTNDIDDNDVGKWICIEESDDYTWVHPVDNAIAYVAEILDKLGYILRIEEKKCVGNE